MARGSVTPQKRKGKDGKPYWVYRAVVPWGVKPDGRPNQKSKILPTSKAAWAWVHEQLAAGPSGADTAITVGDLVERWTALHARTVSSNTMFGYAWPLGRITAELGSVPVASLSVLQVQRFYDGLTKLDGTPLAPSSIGNVHKVLTMVLDLALDWEIITRNPAARTRRPGVEKTDIVWWEPEAVRTFLASTRDDFDGPLWALVLSTGLRIGEAIGLEWRDVDLDAGKMTVNRTMTRTVKGREILGKTTKTKSSRRTIVLPLPAQVALKRQRTAQMARRRAAGELWQESGAVFDRDDGKRRHLKSSRDRFGTLVRDLDLPPLTPHGLRHTVATMLFHLKVPVKQISDLLGHDDILITLNLYTHISDADRNEVARAIEAALGYEEELALTG